jgi:hypothetical protein
VAAAALNPTQPLLAVTSTANTVQVPFPPTHNQILDISRALTAPKILQEFVSHSLPITAVFPASQDTLISASEDGSLDLFDPRGNRLLSFHLPCAVETVETVGPGREFHLDGGSGVRWREGLRGPLLLHRFPAVLRGSAAGVPGPRNSRFPSGIRRVVLSP